MPPSDVLPLSLTAAAIVASVIFLLYALRSGLRFARAKPTLDERLVCDALEHHGPMTEANLQAVLHMAPATLQRTLHRLVQHGTVHLLHDSDGDSRYALRPSATTSRKKPKMQ